MSYTLVLVGGTGQRFGLGLGYLNLLGAVVRPSRVLIVDAEGKGVDSANSVTQLMRRYLGFGSEDIQIDHVKPYITPHTASPTVRDVVDVGNSQVFDLLVSEGEQRLAIERGFYAVPKMASVVFRALEEREPHHFTNQNDDVVIVGSVSGGTGAGIIREIATVFGRDRSRRIYGIVFAQYFSLPQEHGPEGPVELTDRDLQTNSEIGCDYLLRDVQKRKSPFNVLNVIGPPPTGTSEVLPQVAESGKNRPHNFAGTLAALSLVTDGGRQMRQRYESVQRNLPANADGRQTIAQAFGARPASDSHLHDTDINFPIDAGDEYLSLADARRAARVIVQELDHLKQFPFSNATSRLSLFVGRKIGSGLKGTFRKKSRTGVISRGDASDIWDKLLHQASVLTEGLEDLQVWLKSIDELVKTEADSPNVRRTPWRSAVEPPADVLEPERLAQAWCLQVARAQWQPRREELHVGAASRWMFPSFDQTNLPQPGAIEKFEGSVELTHVNQRSFPNPLGAAYAFGKRIFREDQDGALRDAQVLWWALALGWIDLDVVKLDNPDSVFDRLCAKIDGASFVSILKVAKHTRVPPSLEAYKGRAVGAIHRECGVFPGLSQEALQVRNSLVPELNAHQAGIARDVLHRWLGSFRQYLQQHNLPLPEGQAWWTSIKHAAGPTPQFPGPAVPDNVRTVGPVSLKMDEETEQVLYLFVYEPNRGASCHTMLGQIASNQARVMQDGVVVATQTNRALARIRRPVLPPDAGNRLDLALAAGSLDVDILDLHHGSAPADQRAGRQQMLQSLAFDNALFNHFVNTPVVEISIKWPDVLWNRTGNPDPRFGLTVDVPFPEHGPDRKHRLEELCPQVPAELQGVFYHPERRQFIVWLNHWASNPHGRISPVPDRPNRVRVHDGQATWELEFPSNSLIKPPSEILHQDVPVFRDRDGREVLPFLPVKKEYIDLIECRAAPIPATRQGDDIVFTIPLVGGLETQWRLPRSSVRDVPAVHSDIWPDIEHPAWRRFWLSLESDSATVRNFDFAVFEASEHGYYRAITRVDSQTSSRSTLRQFSFIGRPRLIWLGDLQTGGGLAGFGPPAPPRDQAPEGTIAVDFGTFRTAVVVAVPGTLTAVPSPAQTGFVDFRRSIIDNPPEAVRQSHTLMPDLLSKESGRQNPAQTTTAAVFGSALVYPDGPVPTASSVPFVDFGIPSKALELKEYPSTREEAKAGLKWDEGQTAGTLRTAYLKGVLLLACIEAFNRGANTVNLRYSYPLAYDMSAALRQSFVEARTWINEHVIPSATDTAVREPRSESESGAAMRAAQVTDEWVLTADLGGGTLDLALFQEEKNGRPRALAWDSVKLGANIVGLSFAARTGQPERMVRWNIIHGHLRADKMLGEDTMRLFFLCIEYAARVVAGTLLSEKHDGPAVSLTLVLLGSGWRWHAKAHQPGEADRFNEQHFERNYLDYLKNRLEVLAPGRVGNARIHPGFVAEQGGVNDKLVVALGLAMMATQGERTYESIRAPNSLREDDNEWSRMVNDKERWQAPSKVLSVPGFDPNLERRASLSAGLTDVRDSQAILTRLRQVTNVDETRRRTALGITYEQLIARWFKDVG